MAFFNSAVTVLQTLVIALGAGLGIWGAINLLEGYGNDNPGANLLTKAFALNIMYLYDKYIEEQRRGVVEIIISSNTSKPIYEQITSQIKAMIMSGELKPAILFPLCGRWQSPFM